MNNQFPMILLLIMMKQDDDIDPVYTMEKMHLVKRITPLIPEEYIKVVGKSLRLTEQIIKVLEVKDFMNVKEEATLIQSIPVKDNKERINKISSILKDELPKYRNSKIEPIMSLIINMEKYQSMFNIMNALTTSKDDLKDSKNMMNIIAPLLGGKEGKSDGNIKEMMKMMEIIKLLDTPKPDKPTLASS